MGINGDLLMGVKSLMGIKGDYWGLMGDFKYPLIPIN